MISAEEARRNVTAHQERAEAALHLEATQILENTISPMIEEASHTGKTTVVVNLKEKSTAVVSKIFTILSSHCYKVDRGSINELQIYW